MTTLSSIQIPASMVDIIKYGLLIVLIFIIASIIVKCSCFIYETICDTIKWHKIDEDSDDDDYDDSWLDDEDEDDDEDENEEEDDEI